MKLNKTPSGLDFLDSYGLIPSGLKFLDIYGNVVTSATRYYIFKCYAKTQKISGKPKNKFIILTFMAIKVSMMNLFFGFSLAFNVYA